LILQAHSQEKASSIMSESSSVVRAGSVALPLQSPEGIRHVRRAGSEQATSATFYYAAQCWQSGAFWLVQGLVLLAIGFFLYVQIPAAPKLTTQLMICSVLSVIGAMFTLHMAAWNLLSFLRLDRHGVRMRQGVFNTHSLVWEELDCWRIVENDSAMPAVFLWKRGQVVPWTVPGNSLSSEDYAAVRAWLNEHVPLKGRL
jgi:hypothetical protein